MSGPKRKRNKGKERRERKNQLRLSDSAARVAASNEQTIVTGEGKHRKEYREKYIGGYAIRVDNPDFDPDQEESAENKRQISVWKGGGYTRVRIK